MVKDSKEEKFLFDLHDFDTGQKKVKHEEPVEEPEPPPILYTEEDYQKESERAYARGLESGKAEAKKEFEESQARKTEQILIALQDQLGRFYELESQRFRKFEGDAILLFQSFLSKTRPSLQNSILKEKMQNDLVQILQAYEDEALLEMHAHPEAAALINSADMPQMQNLKERLKIVEDKSLDSPLTCKINWKNGGAIIDYEGLIKKIEQSVIDILEVNAIKSEDGTGENLKDHPEDTPQNAETEEENRQE